MMNSCTLLFEISFAFYIALVFFFSSPESHGDTEVAKFFWSLFADAFFFNWKFDLELPSFF